MYVDDTIQVVKKENTLGMVVNGFIKLCKRHKLGMNDVKSNKKTLEIVNLYILV